MISYIHVGLSLKKKIILKIYIPKCFKATLHSLSLVIAPGDNRGQVKFHS